MYAEADMGHPSRGAGFVPSKTIVRDPETK
ncbi:MAG: hypothetical protein QOH35_2493 [Acidobacteriaceae bacterium]|jgi:hypothetical protein|nr:hypothetical protein [Acidobacteriaceae bacterium]